MSPATTDALAQLRDIHLPEAVGSWPLAPGWWGLLALLAAVGVAAGWLWLRAGRKHLRKLALQELRTLEQGDAASDPNALAWSLSMLLRRVALARFDRREVASLHGGGWIAFLQRTGADLDEESARSFVHAMYAPDAVPAAGGSEWISGARRWIEVNT